jgi:hypothetical protein
MGLKDIHCSTISDANITRSYELYKKLFCAILSKTKDITPKHKFIFKNPLYSIDAKVIDLCLSMFSWAQFSITKGALKLHYQYDHSGSIPSFLVVTDAKQHGAKVVKEEAFPLLADSIESVDRGYIDYNWLNSFNNKRVFFVTRAKANKNMRLSDSRRLIRREAYYLTKQLSLLVLL